MKFLGEYLSKKYDKVHKTNKYIIALGDIPVGLVAHLDTVHPFRNIKKEIFYDSTQGVLWSPDGLGADDRAGVYAIIKIIETGRRPTIIFTTDEEIGGLGATQVAKDFPNIIDENLKYLIELDRRGSIDCVFYECGNQKFIDYVEKFGFASQWGTYTDICEICPAWEIAGVNLSIGYEHEHSYAEFLRISWLNTTIHKVINMLDDAKNIDRFEYIKYSRYAWYDSTYDYSGITYRCKACGHMFNAVDVVDVKQKDGSKVFYCLDCLDGGIGWCDTCDSLYVLSEGDRNAHMCASCKAKKEKELKNGNNKKAV